MKKEKARAKLIENKEKRLARKSAPVQQINNMASGLQPSRCAERSKIKTTQPKKEDPVYDDDYEDLEDVEQFMIIL